MVRLSTRLGHLALACGLAVLMLAVFLFGMGRVPAAQARPLAARPPEARAAASRPGSQPPAIPDATYTVTSTASGGAGSLRQAILAANANPGPDAIGFNLTGCPCVILLLNPLPDITGTLSIAGPGAGQLAVDGSDSFRVFDAGAVPLSVSDLTVQHGRTAGRGAGIRAGENLTLTNVTVLSNIAQNDGGGVYVTGTVRLAGARFERNQSLGGAGGGLYAADTVISGTQFLSNTAGMEGGGLYVFDTAAVDGGRFQGNQSLDHDGGGLYVYLSATLTDTEFISNTATASGYGGGIYADEVRLAGARFEGNIGYEGAGIYASTLALTDTAFFSNTAISYGGGAYGNTTFISGGSFERNSAPTDAGGLGAGTLTISGTAFISNTTGGVGGGVYAEGKADIHAARFADNQAGGDGGGLYASGALTLTASTFVGNHAADGGGLYHATDAGRVWNSLFARNTATTGGAALHLTSLGSVEVVHVTVVGALPVTGTGILVDSGAVGITNTIIARQAIGIGQQGGTVNQDYNLFFLNGANTQGTVAGGAHSLVGSPQFVAPNAENYHLGAGSAALDVGTNAGLGIDFDGDARPQDSGFDIGFDEASFITGLALAYAPYPTTTLGAATTFTATITAGSGVTYTWDFGDGTPLGGGNPIAHTYAAAGVYTATVTAANATESVFTTTQVSVVSPLQWIYLPLVLR